MLRKATVKKSTAQSPVQQVQQLKNCLADCQKNISVAYKKAIASSKKQIEQLKLQLNKAKQKLVEIQKAQAKQALVSKGKSVKAAVLTRSKLSSSKTQKASQQAVKSLEQQIASNKKNLVQLQQDQKKFTASLKAQSQFDKQWKKMNVLSLKPKKEAVKKKSKVIKIAMQKKGTNTNPDNSYQQVEMTLESPISISSNFPNID